MEKVAEVATLLAAQIDTKGHKVDMIFVEHLALVHDLMKAIAFRTYDPRSFQKKPTKADIAYWIEMKKKYRGNDIEATSDMLKKMRFKKLAAAVLSQQFDAVISKAYPLKTLEEKIVFYADKRVAHTEIVPLSIRLKEGHLRYNAGVKKPKSDRLKKIELAIHMLEEEIWTLGDMSY